MTVFMAGPEGEGLLWRHGHAYMRRLFKHMWTLSRQTFMFRWPCISVYSL